MVCLEIPASGSLNIEFKVDDDLSTITSQWPVDLGFGIGPNSEKELAARISIDFKDGEGFILQEPGCTSPNNIAYPSCKHPNLHVMLFTGQKADTGTGALQNNTIV